MSLRWLDVITGLMDMVWASSGIKMSGQGSLACCDPWEFVSFRHITDSTELNWTPEKGWRVRMMPEGKG